VGYGTKVGMAPMHSWVPDAYSRSPAPATALLATALSAVSIAALLRFFAIARAALGAPWPEHLLALFGALTLSRSGVDLALDRGELGESLRFGAKGHVQTLLAKLHERVDVMLMAALRVDPAQIAVYAIAVSVIDRLRVVPDSISSALLPKLATVTLPEMGPYTARVTRHLVFWVCASGLALAIAAPFLVPVLFGQPYAASVLPLLVLLPATAMLTVRTMLSNYFVAAGKPGFNAKIQALSVTVNVAANLWAIPRYGILGAAFASLVSYGVEAIATVIAFGSATRCGVGETLVVGRKDLAPYAGRMRRLRERLGGA